MVPGAGYTSGPITFQASELAKLAAIVFVAWWFSKFEAKCKGLLMGLIYPVAVIGMVLALIVLETDLGTTLLIGGVVFLMMFVAGASPRFLGPLVIAAVAGLLIIAWHISERQGRLMAFLHPDQYQEREGHQQWMGLIAFGSGGVDGLGLGNGRQKMLYLPYAHTDFIFPVIGEELGLRMTLAIVFLLPSDCIFRDTDRFKCQRQIWHVAWDLVVQLCWASRPQSI